MKRKENVSQERGKKGERHKKTRETRKEQERERERNTTRKEREIYKRKRLESYNGVKETHESL